MPYVRLPGGIVAHVKVAKRPARRCSATSRYGYACTNAAGFQCDYALGKGRTCDAHLCRVHATNVGPEVDHCPKHAAVQAGLFTNLIPPKKSP